MDDVTQRRIGITKDALDQRKQLTGDYVDTVREMNSQQYELALDGIETRKISQHNLKNQMNKVYNIQKEIDNYSKRVDPNFFWNRRSEGSQSLIINGLVGMASAGVDPIQLINLLTDEISKESKIQKTNIDMDLDQLERKRRGALTQYEYLKEYENNEIVMQSAMSAAYKQKAKTEIEAMAFLIEEGETQTNLLLASEELEKSAIKDRMGISKYIAEESSEMLVRELKAKEDNVALRNLDLNERKFANQQKKEKLADARQVQKLRIEANKNILSANESSSKVLEKIEAKSEARRLENKADKVDIDKRKVVPGIRRQVENYMGKALSQEHKDLANKDKTVRNPQGLQRER